VLIPTAILIEPHRVSPDQAPRTAASHPSPAHDARLGRGHRPPITLILNQLANPRPPRQPPRASPTTVGSLVAMPRPSRCARRTGAPPGQCGGRRTLDGRSCTVLFGERRAPGLPRLRLRRRLGGRESRLETEGSSGGVQAGRSRIIGARFDPSPVVRRSSVGLDIWRGARDD